MTLSVIIVNYNVRYFLEHCLLSVRQACAELDAEIIVVDNASVDDDYQWISNEFKEVKWIANKENLGFSKANNIGASIAKGKYLLVLNPDTFIGENCIKHAINYASEQSNFGALGVRFTDGSGNFMPEGKRCLPTPKAALKKLLGNGALYYNNQLGEFDCGEVEVLSGAFMLLSKSAFDEVGGFDEDYFMYGEDIDLCYKLIKKGYTNYYFGQETVVHYKGESTVKDGAYASRFYGVIKQFYEKHYKINIISRIGISLLVKLMILRHHLFGGSFSQSDNVTLNQVFYLGESEDHFRRLSKIFKNKISRFEGQQIKDNDLLIIDSNSNQPSKIIFKIGHQMGKKRIIPKDRAYFIGSDRSLNRGEVVHF